ncbi:MAG: site-specific recombinase, partial [Nocardioidaceae bacterium]|nr:site-specific recombinase [Nocardioidaceae bacterium]
MAARRNIKTETRPFAIYCRLSRKKPIQPGARPGRDTETVERQEQECREYAAANDLPIADHLVFVDNHWSAWKRKGAKRPEWIEMMAAIDRGEVAGILVYKLDRFTRAPGDMETLIELAERRGLVIRGPLAGHIDLDTANGRREARGAANQAASESDNTSERVRDALAELMASGKPMGSGRAFGFETGGLVQVPAEVAVLRELASRTLAGESLQTLAADLNRRGVTTTRGNTWDGGSLSRVLGAHRYGGWVEHHGKDVAKMKGEPVFDTETYDGLQALLTSRRRGRRPTGRFLLTGLLICSSCQRTMNGATRHKGLADGTKPRIYRCPAHLKGCGVTILAAPVEQIVGEHMVTVLSDPDA